MKHYYKALLLICTLQSTYTACMEQKEYSITTPADSSDDSDEEWVELYHDGKAHLVILSSPIPDAISDIKSSRLPSPVQQPSIKPAPLIIPSNENRPVFSQKSPRSPSSTPTLDPQEQELPRLIIAISPKVSTQPPSLPNPVRVHHNMLEPVIAASPPTLNQPSQSLSISRVTGSAAQPSIIPTPTLVSPSMPMITHKPHAASRSPLLPCHATTQTISPKKPSNPLPLTTTYSIVQSILNMCLHRRTRVEKSSKIID